jgi:RNA polymerase sigma factor (sigma-70 family)
MNLSAARLCHPRRPTARTKSGEFHSSCSRPRSPSEQASTRGSVARAGREAPGWRVAERPSTASGGARSSKDSDRYVSAQIRGPARRLYPGTPLPDPLDPAEVPGQSAAIRPSDENQASPQSARQSESRPLPLLPPLLLDGSSSASIPADAPDEPPVGPKRDDPRDAQPAIPTAAAVEDRLPDGWELLVGHVQSFSRRLGRRLEVPREEADDRASDACFRILKQVRSRAAPGKEWPETAPLRTLARLHVKWAFKDAERAKAHSPEVLGSESIPEDLVDRHDPPDREAETAELVARIQTCLDRLPSRVRAIFKAKYCCNGPSPTNARLASQFGISTITVKKLLATAKRRIFDEISRF